MFQRIKALAWFIDRFERDLIEIVTKADAYSEQMLPLLPETELGNIVAYEDQREDRRNTKNSKLNSSRLIENRVINVFWWDRDELAHVTFAISFKNGDGTATMLMGEATSRGVINWWHPQDAEPFQALAYGLKHDRIDEQFLLEYLEMLTEANEAVEAACEAAIERAEAMRERKQNEE